MYNITHDDYTFAESDRSDDWAIRLKGKYEGVLYQYGQVQAKLNEIEDNGDGQATLSFKYAVIDSCDYDREMLEDSEEFNNYIGAVLQHIITDAFDTGKYKLGDNASDNPDNSTTESTD
jgi:hypothetical protein